MQKGKIAASIAGGLVLGGMAWLGSRGGASLDQRATARARLVPGDTALPEKVDTVVIGGGIVGCMAAMCLAERGQSVALCEKGVVAGEASGRALGYVDALFQHPDKLPLIARSKELWEGMASRIGQDVGYRRTGIAAVFQKNEELDGAASWLDWVSGSPGMDARRVGAKDLYALAPNLAPGAAGALFQPSDGVVEPTIAAPAIAERLRELGGLLFQGCAVNAIETTDGAVSAVNAEYGRIACSAVVLAGGAWSPLLAASLGLDLPQFMAFGTVVRVKGGNDAAGAPAMIDTSRNIVMRPNGGGGYDLCYGRGTVPVTLNGLMNMRRLGPALKVMWHELDPALDMKTLVSDLSLMRHAPRGGISPFERTRILAPRPHKSADKLEREAASSFPGLAGANLVERWAGVLTSTPDNMPVLSGAPGVDGLFVGSGFYYGMTMGPAAGEALADLVTGRSPGVDLAAYRMSRFIDGSPIEFRA